VRFCAKGAGEPTFTANDRADPAPVQNAGSGRHLRPRTPTRSSRFPCCIDVVDGLTVHPINDESRRKSRELIRSNLATGDQAGAAEATWHGGAGVVVRRYADAFPENNLSRGMADKGATAIGGTPRRRRAGPPRGTHRVNGTANTLVANRPASARGDESYAVQSASAARLALAVHRVGHMVPDAPTRGRHLPDLSDRHLTPPSSSCISNLTLPWPVPSTITS